MAQSKPVPDLESLEQLALSLTPADRLALATRLIASVEGSESDVTAWTTELRRRAAETAADPSKRIPWSVVRAELDEIVRQHTNRP